MARGDMRKVVIAGFSIVAVVTIGAGLRAAAPAVGVSADGVQQVVVGSASFSAHAGPLSTLITFEDQPPNAPLSSSAYLARGVTIEQIDGFPLYVGEWRFPEAAMIVPSGAKAISSSWAGAPLPGFSQVCNAPPSCVLFFKDAASDRIRFTFTTPASAAGIHLGQNDVAGTRVTWYDTAGAVIESRLFPGFQPWSDFVGLVNAARPIGSMLVENAANNGDAVYFDDLMFVPVTRASDERPFWTEAAPLNAARYGHTTTLLNDGRVLVAGGADAAGTPLSSAELYDPASNRWTSVPSMTVARSDHGAALLDNGLVLVTGGSTVTTFLKTAELYDPVANAWRSAGAMAFPRSSHTETRLPDGRVLVTGGYTSNTDPYQAYANSAELYDPVTNTWGSTGSMQTRRIGHIAALLRDGRVLIAGGANYAEYVDTAEIFSPATGAWTSAGAMSDRRYGAAAVTRPDGTVLVIGGANFFGRLAATAIFSPAGGWTAGPVMQSARFFHVAVAMGDQKILVAGGHSNTSLVSAEMLDPTASPGQWTPIASLHTPRYSAGSAVLLQDGGVLVAGGYNHPAGTAVSGAEIWNSGRTITALTLDPAAGTFGGVVSLTARLTAFGSPVSGRSVVFALNGTAAGTATTDGNGVAALGGVSIASLAPGSYPRGVSASVDGDSTSTPSAATADLTIEDANRAPVAAASATPNPAAATSAAGAVVSIDASASTDPDGDALTYRWSEGTTPVATTASANVTLAIGTHLLTVTVDDGKGATASATVTVRVIDTTAPTVTITAPQQSAIYQIGILQRHAFACQDAFAGIASCYSPSAGGEFFNTFTPGTKTFSVTATDWAGNQTTLAVTYTVNAPPAAAAAATPNPAEAAFPAAAGADVVLSAAGSSDSDGTITTYSWSLNGVAVASGATATVRAPLGTSAYLLTVTDNDGATAQTAVTVVVRDTTPPAFAGGPTPISKEATGPAGAVATWTAPTATDLVGGALPVTCDRASGSTFALGTTSVTCAATDPAGNRASVSFTVTVADTTAPGLIVPPPFALMVEATGPAGAQITFNMTAPDAVSGTVPATCLPVNGTMFPIGVTTVTCSATDAAGNRATISFPYTVRDTRAPVVTVSMPADAMTLFSSSFTVDGITATDAVGVTSVTVNGFAAAQSAADGTWTASVPVPSGQVLVFTIVAKDFAGNTTTRQAVVDNDGIRSAIDRNPATRADESMVFSAGFVNGLTVGSIADRAGNVVLVAPSGSGVVVSVPSGSFPARTAVVNACPGTKQVWLERNELARIECTSAGSIYVFAASALPIIEVRKLVRGGLLGRYTYWTQTGLRTSQAITTGSPAAADPANTEPLTVTMLRVDEDGTETIVGTMVLDPGESADVDFVADPNGGDDRAQIVGLSGDVQVTLMGSTFIVHAGETKTPVIDRTAPLIASVTSSVPVVWPPDGKMVTETISVFATDNVDAAPVCKVTGVTSNEPVSAEGDWKITGPLTLEMRAARLGGGSGRIYTVTVHCTDVAGNASTATAAVTVPHD
jgi:N-acetylneuraminic acid mutarotase